MGGWGAEGGDTRGCFNPPRILLLRLMLRILPTLVDLQKPQLCEVGPRSADVGTPFWGYSIVVVIVIVIIVIIVIVFFLGTVTLRMSGQA